MRIFIQYSLAFNKKTLITLLVSSFLPLNYFTILKRKILDQKNRIKACFLFKVRDMTISHMISFIDTNYSVSIIGSFQIRNHSALKTTNYLISS